MHNTSHNSHVLTIRVLPIDCRVLTATSFQHRAMDNTVSPRITMAQNVHAQWCQFCCFDTAQGWHRAHEETSLSGFAPSFWRGLSVKTNVSARGNKLDEAKGLMIYRTLLHLVDGDRSVAARKQTKIGAHRIKTSPRAPLDFPSWNSSVFASCMAPLIRYKRIRLIVLATHLQV